jgi:GNAT superfamily N-acetyltransferase
MRIQKSTPKLPGLPAGYAITEDLGLGPKHLNLCHPNGLLRKCARELKEALGPIPTVRNNGAVIGFAAAIEGFSYSYKGKKPIICVVVHPDHRKQGLGAKLVEAAACSLLRQYDQKSQRDRYWEDWPDFQKPQVYYVADWMRKLLENAGFESVDGSWSNDLDGLASEEEVQAYRVGSETPDPGME